MVAGDKWVGVEGRSYPRSPVARREFPASQAVDLDAEIIGALPGDELLVRL
jgi:hypothetical protein